MHPFKIRSTISRRNLASLQLLGADFMTFSWSHAGAVIHRTSNMFTTKKQQNKHACQHVSERMRGCAEHAMPCHLCQGVPHHKKVPRHCGQVTSWCAEGVPLHVPSQPAPWSRRFGWAADQANSGLQVPTMVKGFITGNVMMVENGCSDNIGS